uniref:Uncharacterized protein n=1 Tax=Pseudomonas fluorescens (strain SBW25) TaxID=216595 RepID=A0A0G4E628_PSEFS|nr:hypothetical protein PQBR55_0084 [Pseudomonas fluorescens SBW25]
MPATKPQHHNLLFQGLGPAANSLQYVTHFLESVANQRQ